MDLKVGVSGPTVFNGIPLFKHKGHDGHEGKPGLFSFVYLVLRLFPPETGGPFFNGTVENACFWAWLKNDS
jgi:hypothetical protein